MLLIINVFPGHGMDVRLLAVREQSKSASAILLMSRVSQ
jgi:hypothetical protein